MIYNFKRIQVVPSAMDMVNIVLSQTQRKTPTEIHPGYAVGRIRAFYMRKVKYCQQTFHDRLTQILDDFPVLDDLHPFYGDLLNILYDKDHYKLALGQLSTARRLIDNLAQEHVRFLKFGDSLYRCKQLKRAALGRMCTIVKGQAASLAYLEQVRQHLARLPAIDPNTRTLICTGFPNVGKSSMLNRLTRANVDVQPYAFTTKSLFVGHMDYEYLRWQVIDTPGILDHPLEERNTIEMQGVTALAHLRAAVLFVLDISAQCGYSVRQQVGLFENIRPLFIGKPLVVALNKIDVVRPEQLDPADQQLIKSLEEEHGAVVVPMSTLTEEGVAAVKKTACDLLLAQRTEEKLSGSKAQSILARLHLAMPAKRDSLPRPPCIPDSVFVERSSKSRAMEGVETAAASSSSSTTAAVAAAAAAEAPGTKTKAEEEIEQGELDDAVLEMGENPWTSWMKDREGYLLDDPEWKQDVIPEIIDGKNVADFVDPEIMARLDELEREEEKAVAEEEAEASMRGPQDAEEEDIAEREEELADEIRGKRRVARVISRHKRAGGSKMLARVASEPRTASDLQQHLISLGIDPALASEAAEGAVSRALTVSRQSRKRTRSMSRVPRTADADDVEEGIAAKRREMEASRERSRSRSPGAMSKVVSIPDQYGKDKAIKLMRAASRVRNKQGAVGEGDRRIISKMPKHLFSGKRKQGTHSRR